MAKESGDSWTKAHLVDNYEPVLDRTGTERRVLGFVSDEAHGVEFVGFAYKPGGPRNTLERLCQELASDPFTKIGAYAPDPNDLEYAVLIHQLDQVPEVVQGILDGLIEKGLLELRDDGTYGVTPAGIAELVN